MKFTTNRFQNLNTSFLFLLSAGPEGNEQLGRSEAKPEVDPAVVSREGMRGVNTQIEHIGRLSPEASQIVGERLPGMISRGLTSPEDARHIGEEADRARTTIAAQIPEEGAEGNDYPPEVYAEVNAWFEEIEAQMAVAQKDLAEQAAANPDNEDLARQLGAFNGMMTDVSRLKNEASEDLSVLEQRALEGGVTGPIGERLAQVAQGEVGAANSDAEGNAKYTPGGVDQHWCADFVNWCIEEAGGQGTDSSAAQSFVQGEGKGHVAIVATADGGTVGGNEGSAVSDGGNASRFEKAISAEAVSEGRFDEVKSASEAQVGDIVVRGREEGAAASAEDQSVT